jgi:hypothetical protein
LAADESDEETEPALPAKKDAFKEVKRQRLTISMPTITPKPRLR